MNFLRVACVPMLLSLLLALVACEKERSFEDHLAAARQFVADSEYELALVELKSALRQDGQSGEARWLLGQAYLASGDPVSAVKELKKSLALGWDPNDVVPPLAESLYATGRFDQVFALQDASLGAYAKADLLAIKALSHTAAGDRYQAMALADQALDLAPESITAQLAKARILVGEGDFAAALLLLEQVIDEAPDIQAASSLMGDVHVGLKQPELALASYDRAISLRPGDDPARLRRALLHVQLGDFQRAEADAGRLLATSPRDPAANYVQGLIHFMAGRFEEAVTPLTLATLDFSQYPLGLFFLSCAHLRTGDVVNASGLAAQFQELVPDSIRGRKLLAFIRLHAERYEDVLVLLDPVLQARPETSDVLYMMAVAMLRSNRIDEGITLLERTTAVHPDFSPDSIGLGPGRLLEGDSDDPADYLETALGVAAEFQLTELLEVVEDMREGDHAAAIEGARALEAGDQPDHLSLVLLGKIYLSARQPDRARDAFEKIIEVDPHDPAANHNLARMAIADGDLASAGQHYEKVLDRDAENLVALTELARIRDDAEDDAAVWLLQRAVWAHESAVEPRLQLGRHYLAQGKPRSVRGLFMDLEPVQQQSAQVLELVAMAQLAAEEQAEEKLRIAAQTRREEQERARTKSRIELNTRGRRLIAGWVYKLAPRYGLDPDLVLAVIKAESNFNPGARSPANALGLMQLIPATAARFGVRDRADPLQNLHGGMSYLRWLLSFFEGELPLALAGYNAGEGSVVKYLGIPPFPETQNYVRKILRDYGSRVHPPVKPVARPTRQMAAIRANLGLPPAPAG